MQNKHIFITMSLCLLGICLSCTSQTKDQTLVTSDNYDFDPDFKKSTDAPINTTVIVPPANLLATPSGGDVLITWTIPKYYTLSKYNIGYRIYMKSGNVSDLSGWDFSNPFSTDRTTLVAVVTASDKTACLDGGVCHFKQTIGSLKTMQIAMITADSLSSTGEGGHESTPVAGIVSTPFVLDDERYNVGFIDGKFGGAVIYDGPVQPTSLSAYSFTDQSVIDPWLLPLDGFVASNWQTTNLPEGYGAPVISGSSIATSVDPKGDAAAFADRANHRIVVKTRQGTSSCDASVGTPFYQECLRILRTSGTVASFVVGQPNPTTNYSFDLNPLGPARAIEGGTYRISIERDSAGDLWFFAADRARILVRKGMPRPCSLENIASFSKDTGGTLSDGTVVGPEGACGFMWSIGTRSPRLTCGLRANGLEPTDESLCSASDMNMTLADAVAPTNQSLRYPGAPAIIGDDLYIPDGGNARVLRLHNFKTALSSCGRLKTTGAALDPRCSFDMVLGQTESTPLAGDQFSRRKCVRGGERGGKDNLTSLPDFSSIADPLEPVCAFVGDPACAGNTGTGGSCLLDLVTETIPGPTPYQITRRKRQVKDYKNVIPGSNMLSPSTGLLDDKALAMFRFPVSVHQDYKGRILVYDMGETFAQESSSAPKYSVVGNRVMLWNRDPFSISYCPAGGNCAMTSTGNCTGGDCALRQCQDLECQAYTIIGQKNAKFAYAGFDGQVSLPTENELGFIPIVAVSIPKTEEGRGVWAVTGQSRKIYRWKAIDQFETPDLHNAEQKNGINGEVMLGGVFSGIEVDTAGASVSGYDPIKNFFMNWFAPPSGQASAVSSFGF
jgi:hypothetical protein